jgi:hypothetical protein
MKSILNSVILPALLITTMPCVFAGMVAEAADLSSNTLKEWTQFVDAREKCIAAELTAQKEFLVLDYQNPEASTQERQTLLSGNISIRPMAFPGNDSGEIRISGGMIHHWRGSIWVPGINLDFVLSRVKHPELDSSRQEDVLAARILENSPDQIKLYLKLQRSRIVTVVYNTEHIVRFDQHGTERASSRSISTKIAEVEQLNKNTEREKPEGHDRGFLWKMNSYWRYQQAAGGVIIECESITLSRSIPSFLEAIIRPLIRSIARESMQRTLQSMRVRLEQAYKAHSMENTLQGKAEKISTDDYLLFECRSKAALVVTGSIRAKATRAPIATAISRVAITA